MKATARSGWTTANSIDTLSDTIERVLYTTPDSDPLVEQSTLPDALMEIARALHRIARAIEKRDEPEGHIS